MQWKGASKRCIEEVHSRGTFKRSETEREGNRTLGFRHHPRKVWGKKSTQELWLHEWLELITFPLPVYFVHDSLLFFLFIMKRTQRRSNPFSLEISFVGSCQVDCQVCSAGDDSKTSISTMSFQDSNFFMLEVTFVNTWKRSIILNEVLWRTTKRDST